MLEAVHPSHETRRMRRHSHRRRRTRPSSGVALQHVAGWIEQRPWHVCCRHRKKEWALAPGDEAVARSVAARESHAQNLLRSRPRWSALPRSCAVLCSALLSVLCSAEEIGANGHKSRKAKRSRGEGPATDTPEREAYTPFLACVSALSGRTCLAWASAATKSAPRAGDLARREERGLMLGLSIRWERLMDLSHCETMSSRCICLSSCADLPVVSCRRRGHGLRVGGVRSSSVQGEGFGGPHRRPAHRDLCGRNQATLRA
jgi:hypothetical protein